MAQCLDVTTPYVNPFPKLAKFLVLAKSHMFGSFRIVAFNGLQLFDINVPFVYKPCIQPGKTYQFQLRNPWDPAVVAALPVDVQGEPHLVEMLQNGFAALQNIVSKSFRSIYPNIVIQGDKPFLNVGNIFQPPRAFLVQGNSIKKRILNDGTTRCIISTDVGEIDIRYTGDGPDRYIELPEDYNNNLLHHYTLILVVADPLSNEAWIGTRNYILVVAIY